MPWQPKDAARFNKGASSKRLQQTWASIANEKLRQTGDEGRAVREANRALKGRHYRDVSTQKPSE